MSRIRHFIREIESKYTSEENRALLKNFVRVFRGIQKLNPSNKDSFFIIAGYHGEPFREKGVTDSKWWGDYCHHDDVLFSFWHRAYVLRLEDALRSVSECQDVTFFFWDECFTSISGGGNLISAIFTASNFDLDDRNDNPIYSYKLQKALVKDVEGAQ